MSTSEVLFGAWNYEKAKSYALELEPFSLKLAGAYMLTVFSLKYYMKDRKPFDLQRPLNIWNGILAVFSLLGFLFTFPTFLSVVFKHGLGYVHLHISECFTASSSGYWVFLWVLSKIPELVDTIFIVLRKRPLMLMHWYHHALTGYYALICYHEENAHMIWVVWMNYLVHTFMYGYYLLRSMGIKVPAYVAQAITTSQMVQFTFAILAQLHVAVLSINSDKYAVTQRGWIIGFFMLTTYYYLWIQFYKESYVNKGGKKYLRDQKEQASKKQ